MKKVLLIFVCAISTKCYAQKRYTTVYLFSNPDCHCMLQFAKDRKPFGPQTPIKRDTMFVAVSPKSSGFFVFCSDSLYYDIAYNEDGYYKIKIPCKSRVFIKRFHEDPGSEYISNMNPSQGLEFYFNTKKEMDDAKFYVINSFDGEDLGQLFQGKKVLKEYFRIQVNEEYMSVPGDLIFMETNTSVAFYYHCRTAKEYKDYQLSYNDQRHFTTKFYFETTSIRKAKSAGTL